MYRVDYKGFDRTPVESKPVALEPGERFTKLVVLRKRDNRYSCGCDCGGRILVSARKLLLGHVKSCDRCAEGVKK